MPSFVVLLPIPKSQWTNCCWEQSIYPQSESHLDAWGVLLSRREPQRHEAHVSAQDCLKALDSMLVNAQQNLDHPQPLPCGSPANTAGVSEVPANLSSKTEAELAVIAKITAEMMK